MAPLLVVFLACSAIDGDTLRCGHERVRLLRIDAAERGQPGARAATDFLAAEIDGRRVTCRVTARDVYRRLLADCSAGDGVSLGDKLLARRLVSVYRREP